MTLANDVPSNVTALNASLAPGVAAENATRETTRDGTTAYLAALHTLRSGSSCRTYSCYRASSQDSSHST